MKPNDEALTEALAVFKNMLDPDDMRRALTAAYAAQFKSEDYAGLVEDLRAFDEELLNAQPHSCEQTAKQAADALEAVLAERDALKAENNELREENENIQAANRYGKDWVDQASQDIASLRAERDALAARLAPVEDEALVEIARQTIIKETGGRWGLWPGTLAAVISAIRPHIEAAERERCAKIAEGSFLFDIETWLNSTKKEMTAHVAKAIAAAIRSGK